MPSDFPNPRSSILQIEAYVPGESAVRNGNQPIKLSSNETPLGPSKHALAAYFEAAHTLARYPDGEAKILKQAIAELYRLNPSSLVCGAGSDDILNLISHAYIEPGHEGVYSQYGFLLYKIVILASGGVPISAEETNFTADVDKILEKISPRTRVVFLANPNNPTGTYLSHDEVLRLRSKLPSHILLVLDGAYAEYVEQKNYDSGLDIVQKTKNTIVTRTFSKIYGLAGLRVGWAYCPPEVANILNRIRGPFNVSTPSILSATAAIKDQEHVKVSVNHNTKWLSWMKAEIEKLGFSVTPSIANFLLVHFPKDKDKGAIACDEFLKSRAIIVRRVASYGLPHSLRISIGTQVENEKFIAALSEFQNTAT